MLLTRKSSSAGSSHSASSLVGRLHRGLSQALPTLDRRGFLRRSGVGVGVGLGVGVGVGLGAGVGVGGGGASADASAAGLAGGDVSDNTSIGSININS